MNPTTIARRRNERGYTLVMVIFMVATMIILAAAATPVVLTEGRRQMEAEMVWRGEQYERAIGLFYRKFGRYPTSVDNLVKGTNGVRFLRQAYKDPMNKPDGSWRLIYVGPNGQLIGSLRRTSLLQTTLNGAQGIPGLVPLGGGPQPPPQGGTSGQQAAGQQPTGAGTASSEPQPQPLTGDVLGGNIIGVGSKIDQPSFRVYLGGDTYQKWEFIWNPVNAPQQQQNIPGLGVAAPGVPVPAQPPPPQSPQVPGTGTPPQTQ